MNNVVEQEIISCILKKPKLFNIAVGQISADDFQLPEYASVFECMHRLFLDNKPIDVVMLVNELGKEYAELLTDTQFAAITTVNFEHHLTILQEISRKAKAKALSAELVGMLDDEKIEICQDKATALLQALGTRPNVAQANAMQGIEGFLERINQPINYFDTGFELLNRYAYIQRGDYIVIGGRPSSGKTALTLQMAAYMSKTRNVIYFSCETSKEKVYDRVMAHNYNIGMDVIKKRNIPEEIKKYLQHKKGDFANLKLLVVEASDWTVAQIKAKAVEEQAEIVFVDYLTMLKSRGKSLYEATTNLSRELHIMAQQSGIAVVALSQLNRSGEGEPSNTALRESGQIEQDADLIIMIWDCSNAEHADGFTHALKITKNKEGELKKFKMQFNGKFQTFNFITSREE